jgi:hypothetical protein
MSKNRVDSLAPDDVEEGKGRAGRAFGAAFQLQHVARREIQIPRENRLVLSPQTAREIAFDWVAVAKWLIFRYCS